MWLGIHLKHELDIKCFFGPSLPLARLYQHTLERPIHSEIDITMASPPYSYSPTALSPPYPAHSQLPVVGMNATTNKKRTADGGTAPALKRRKASTMSATSNPPAHPLRQTSFPPDESQTPYDARSPSVDSVSLVSGSQASAAVPPKKKRGRKSKVEKAREQTPSVAGGIAATAISGTSDGGRGSKSATGVGGGDNTQEEEDDTVPTQTAQRTQEQQVEEQRMRAMLVNAFSPEQFERYENWRAANLPKAVVRRVG
jgi:transcription initiation factor TFIID subunit 11